jgi:hypothetical protein
MIQIEGYSAIEHVKEDFSRIYGEYPGNCEITYSFTRGLFPKMYDGCTDEQCNDVSVSSANGPFELTYLKKPLIWMHEGLDVYERNLRAPSPQFYYKFSFFIAHESLVHIKRQSPD